MKFFLVRNVFGGKVGDWGGGRRKSKENKVNKKKSREPQTQVPTLSEDQLGLSVSQKVLS